MQKLMLTVLTAASIALAIQVSSPFAHADFDWSPLIGQWEARTPNIGTYPPGATPLNISSGNEAAATATATLPAATGATTWITGWAVNGGGATAASLISCTVTGLAGGTETRTFAVASGVTAASTALVVTYPAALPASAADTAIAVSCPSFGSGNTNATVNAYGFQSARTP